VKPTNAQINYLEHLACKAGQTFYYPPTRPAASQQIQRLKAVIAGQNQALERSDARRERRAISRALQEGRGDATHFRDEEITGHGSTATWR
jgi:hypothetical protein